MSLEVTGKVKVINPEIQVSASFKKRELVVATDEQYPQHILIEFTQEKCDILNQYKIGDSVKVDINLRGREWINPQGEAKYFNTIQAWKISKITDANPSAVDSYQADDNDDLPFI